MNISLISAFVVYFVILLTIGLSVHRKQRNDADFILGNRSLNFWLTALSAHASDMSAWLFMAFPAAIFMGGLPQIWVAFGLILGMFLNWQFISTPLRLATEKYNSYTLSTFFERRFNDPSNVLRLLTATMAVLFLTVYLAAGLIAMGILFESIFGIDYFIGISIATFVAMIYTFVGGYLTVAWTDLFQAIFLLIAILIVPIIGYFHLANGSEEIIQIAQAKNIHLTLLPDYSPATILNVIFLIFGWGLGYFGQPHIITKFMGIKDPNQLKNSKYLGMSWQTLALGAATTVGLVGIAYFPDNLENNELVFVNMVSNLFWPFFGGLILCGLIAANVSTMDSQMLVCASILSEDFYKHIVHQKASPKKLLWVSRFFVVVISLVALGVAFGKSSTVQSAVQYAWSGLGCSFGPLILLALYSKSTTRQGALAGILVGGIISATWHLLNPLITSLEVPSMIVGFSASFLAILLVSKLTKHS